MHRQPFCFALRRLDARCPRIGLQTCRNVLHPGACAPCARVCSFADWTCEGAQADERPARRSGQLHKLQRAEPRPCVRPPSCSGRRLRQRRAACDSRVCELCARPQPAAARFPPFWRANSTRRKSTRLEIHLLTPDGLQVPAAPPLSRPSLTRCLRAAHCGRSYFWSHRSHPPLSTARASALATPRFFITAGAQRETTDLLFVLTERHKFCVLKYEKGATTCCSGSGSHLTHRRAADACQRRPE